MRGVGGAGLLGCALLAAPLQAQGGALEQTPSRFASWNGIRLHYKSLGLGTTAVVFVHGWVSDLSVWRLQVPVIEGRARALFLDLPGFGRSDHPPAGYSMDYFADAIDAVMVAAGVERAVLVGHSMGTPMIRQFYRRHPAKVIGLVVVDGPLAPLFSDSLAARSFLAGFEGAEYPKHLDDFLGAMMGPGADSALRASLNRMAHRAPQSVAVSAMRGMLDPAIWGEDPIEVPALVVMANDQRRGPGYAASVKKLVPGVRYERIEGSGHFIMLEKPGVFNALLTDFLKARDLLR